MAGLDGQDGASSREVSIVGDVLGGTEVGRDTDTLEELRGGDEAVNSSQAKVVGASLHGLVTESLGQEGDVVLLLTADLLVSVVDVSRVSSGLKGSLGGKVLVVEGALEVLEGQGVVEDDIVDVGLTRGSSLSGCRWGSGGQRGGNETGNDRVLHCGKERKEGGGVVGC